MPEIANPTHIRKDDMVLAIVSLDFDQRSIREALGWQFITLDSVDEIEFDDEYETCIGCNQKVNINEGGPMPDGDFLCNNCGEV